MEFQASSLYQKQVPESDSMLHQFCIMLALCLQKILSLCRRFRICVSCREAKVWSRSCGLQGLLRNIGTWSFLATVSGKCGFQPSSCPCSPNVTHCRKEFFSIFLSEESIPFVKSKCPLPTRSLRSLRAAAYSIPA